MRGGAPVGEVHHNRSVTSPDAAILTPREPPNRGSSIECIGGSASRGSEGLVGSSSWPATRPGEPQFVLCLRPSTRAIYRIGCGIAVTCGDDSPQEAGSHAASKKIPWLAARSSMERTAAAATASAGSLRRGATPAGTIRARRIVRLVVVARRTRLLVRGWSRSRTVAWRIH